MMVGFAHAVAAHQGCHRALLHGHVDAKQDFGAAISCMQVFDLCNVAHAPSPRYAARACGFSRTSDGVPRATIFPSTRTDTSSAN